MTQQETLTSNILSMSILKRLPTFSKLIVYISMRNQCRMDLPSAPGGLQIIEALCKELNG